MVTIYRFSDLQAGRFASKENLSAAKSKTMSVLKKLHSQGLLEGACVFGSVARGDHSIGSDVDVVVVSKTGSLTAVKNELGKLSSYCQQTLHVKPSIILVDSREARSGNHSVSPFLLAHIGSNTREENLVGKKPASLLRAVKTDWADNESHQLRYLVNSARKHSMELRGKKAKDSDAYYSDLGHAVDRSINYSRHLLDIYGELPQVGGKVDDSKAAIVRQYARLFSRRRSAVAALNRVVSAKDAYTQALHRAIAALGGGNAREIAVSRSAYAKALAQLESVLHDHEVLFAENVKLLAELNEKRFVPAFIPH